MRLNNGSAQDHAFEEGLDSDAAAIAYSVNSPFPPTESLRSQVIVSSYAFLRIKGIKHPVGRSTRGRLILKVEKIQSEALDDEFAGLIARCSVSFWDC
jgi:hypothetical protein